MGYVLLSLCSQPLAANTRPRFDPHTPAGKPYPLTTSASKKRGDRAVAHASECNQRAANRSAASLVTVRVCFGACRHRHAVHAYIHTYICNLHVYTCKHASAQFLDRTNNTLGVFFPLSGLPSRARRQSQRSSHDKILVAANSRAKMARPGSMSRLTSAKKRPARAS